jgi:hypothetical protein
MELIPELRKHDFQNTTLVLYLLEPSHSWTQKEVMVVPSTDLMTHTRCPLAAVRKNKQSISGTTFWTNT